MSQKNLHQARLCNSSKGSRDDQKVTVEGQPQSQDQALLLLEECHVQNPPVYDVLEGKMPGVGQQLG